MARIKTSGLVYYGDGQGGGGGRGGAGIHCERHRQCCQCLCVRKISSYSPFPSRQKMTASCSPLGAADPLADFAAVAGPLAEPGWPAPEVSRSAESGSGPGDAGGVPALRPGGLPVARLPAETEGVGLLLLITVRPAPPRAVECSGMFARRSPGRPAAPRPAPEPEGDCIRSLLPERAITFKNRRGGRRAF